MGAGRQWKAAHSQQEVFDSCSFSAVSSPLICMPSFLYLNCRVVYLFNVQSCYINNTWSIFIKILSTLLLTNVFVFLVDIVFIVMHFVLFLVDNIMSMWR